MTELEPRNDIESACAGAISASHEGRQNTPASALDSGQLLGGQPAVTIIHEGARYVLRATRNGKLILTK